MTNRDQRWMEVARLISTWSRDPRRKVGCVVVDDDDNQLSGGYNGFPRGIVDDDRLDDRNMKNLMVVHAEANAIAAAARNGHSLKGGTLYVTHNPCSQCACLIIQAGIKRVVYIMQPNVSSDWLLSFKVAIDLLTEANISIALLTLQ